MTMILYNNEVFEVTYCSSLAVRSLSDTLLQMELERAERERGILASWSSHKITQPFQSQQSVAGYLLISAVNIVSLKK